MKMPNFSKMTVDALMSARASIDELLKKRAPSARRELEQRLDALSNFFGGESKRGRKSKAKSDGRSKLKGRRVPPKYRSENGETWSGRGMKPRWLSAAIKGGADLEDFAIGARGPRRKGEKVSGKGRKKRAIKRSAPKHKAAKPARRRPAVVKYDQLAQRRGHCLRTLERPIVGSHELRSCSGTSMRIADWLLRTAIVSRHLQRWARHGRSRRTTRCPAVIDF